MNFRRPLPGLTILLSLLLPSCASSRTGLSRGERQEPLVSVGAGETLSSRLAAVSAGSAALEGVRIRVDWLRGGKMESAEVYGNGSAIANDQIGLRLPVSDVRELTGALQSFHFPAMQRQYGETETEFLRMQGKVTVSIDGMAKTVVQTTGGSQSEELATLAARILDVVVKRQGDGVTASDLADGLQKIVSRAIPAEALLVTAQRRDDRARPSEDGWLLRFRGRESVMRPFGTQRGFGAASRLLISDAEARNLASILLQNGAASFPHDLYAPMYTELRIQVLGRGIDLQARPYIGITAETHAARQRSFDRIYGELRRLGTRTLSEGKSVDVVD